MDTYAERLKAALALLPPNAAQTITVPEVETLADVEWPVALSAIQKVRGLTVGTPVASPRLPFAASAVTLPVGGGSLASVFVDDLSNPFSLLVAGLALSGGAVAAIDGITRLRDRRRQRWLERHNAVEVLLDPKSQHDNVRAAHRLERALTIATLVRLPIPESLHREAYSALAASGRVEALRLVVEQVEQSEVPLEPRQQVVLDQQRVELGRAEAAATNRALAAAAALTAIRDEAIASEQPAAALPSYVSNDRRLDSGDRLIESVQRDVARAELDR